MSQIKNLLHKIGETHGTKSLIYKAGLMFFFWALFDGIISFATPILISSQGYSRTQMGLIMSSSSIFGAIFDFVLSKVLKNTHFRRIYLFLFVLCFIQPLILWKANSIFILVLAMGIWGLYYDLLGFGLYDLYSHEFPKKDNSSNSGIRGIFKTLGYLVAPIIAGLMIGTSEVIPFEVFEVALIFLTIAFLFYLIVSVQLHKKEKPQHHESKSPIKLHLLGEAKIWERLTLKLWPVLTFSVLLTVIDSFFWTIGPLYSEGIKGSETLSGFLMTAYSLPTLMVGWFIGRITAKFGKKRSGYWSALAGLLVMSLLALVNNFVLVIGIVFISSILTSVSFPAIESAYVDYMVEGKIVEKEIVALTDLMGNIAYIIGPLIAGFTSDIVGTKGAFAAAGIVGSALIIVIILTTPKHIIIKRNEMMVRE